MTRLHGTKIHDLAVGEREIVLLSDLHLRPERPRDVAALDQVLATVEPGRLVVLLGDVFDYWVGRPQLRDPAWRAIVDQIARHAARGIDMFVMWGNRDFQLERSFERASGASVIGGLRLQRDGGRPLLCLHGDELCQNDRKYQHSKKILRAAPLRFVLHRLPFRVSQLLAGGARAISKRSVARAEKTSLHPSRAAIAATGALGADLVFGHIHRAAAACEPVRFWVLPAFEAETRGHARWRAGEPLQLYEREKPVDWPEGCALSP